MSDQDSTQQAILKNLAEIHEWIDGVQDLSALRTNDDFMEPVVKAMAFCLYLLKVSASLTSSNLEAAGRGVSRYRAVPLGLIVRITKLYEGVLTHVCKNQLELANIFIRPIYETDVRLHYLLTAPNRRAAIRSYIETSRRDVPERLRELLETKATRALSPVEQRMLRNIRVSLRRDRISAKALASRRNWNLDGKDFRGLLRAVGREAEYKWLYGPQGRHQHGAWSEVSMYHLTHSRGRYQPRLTYTTPDPRISMTAILCLRVVVRYLRWSRPPGWRAITHTSKRLEDALTVILEANEHVYSSGQVR